MSESDLKTLIEEALLDMDPELDITAGSPAQTKVVDRVLAYVGEDPFDTDMETFIKARLKQEFDQLGQENATAIADLLIKPYRLLIEPVVREINVMKQRQSVQDINIPSSLVYSGSMELTSPTEVEGIDAGKLVLSPTRTYGPVIVDILREFRGQVHGMVHCSGGAQTKVLHFISQLHVIKDNLFSTPPLFLLIQQHE